MHAEVEAGLGIRAAVSREGLAGRSRENPWVADVPGRSRRDAQSTVLASWLRSAVGRGGETDGVVGRK
jgi:hypothetical protein